MKSTLNILLVGDNGVGKSTLINTFISRKFTDEVPLVITDAVIPSENSSNNLFLSIVDSSAGEDKKIIKKKIKHADCVIVVYDLTNRNSYENMMTKWLPMVKKNASNTVVVVVGTKCDQMPDNNEHIQMIITNEVDILSKFKQVSRCCRCSSKQQTLVEYVFRCAELAVNFPIHPLYDLVSHSFTKDCARAFKRIFRAYDKDNDGLLSDTELNQMQWDCFGMKLQQNDIADVKRKLLKTEGVRGPAHLLHSKITSAGFEKLLSFFMEREHTHSLWTILRRFGYDDDLVLDNYPEPILSSDSGCVAFLSPAAINFIVGLARSASIILGSGDSAGGASEKEQHVSRAMVDEIFSALPHDATHPWSDGAAFRANNQLFLQPWSRKRPSNSPEAAARDLSRPPTTEPTFLNTYRLRQSDWLAHWKALACRCPELVQTLLFEIGYVDRIDSGILVRTTLRPIPRLPVLGLARNGNDLSNLCVCVAGSYGVGKSSLVWQLSGMVGAYQRGETETLMTGSSHINVRNSLMQDVIWYEQSPTSGSTHASGMRLESVLNSDMTLILVDVSASISIEFAIELDRRLPGHLPRLFVATKADVISHSELPCDCSDADSRSYQELVGHLISNGYPKLLWVSGLTGQGVDELCVAVTQMALRPDRAIPTSSKRWSEEFYFVLGVGVSIAVALSTLVIRYPFSDWFPRIGKKTR